MHILDIYYYHYHQQVGTLHPRVDLFNASNGMTERELFVSAGIQYIQIRFVLYRSWNIR